MIWACTVVHLIWGTGLIIHGEYIKNITALSDLVIVFRSPEIAGIFLLAVGLMALYEILFFDRNHTFPGVLWVLPQQIVLMAAAYSAFVAVVFTGQYPDGYSTYREFIFHDQLWTLTAALFHTGAIIDCYFGKILYGKWDGT